MKGLIADLLMLEVRAVGRGPDTFAWLSCISDNYYFPSVFGEAFIDVY
jgi:hypothetical protein